MAFVKFLLSAEGQNILKEISRAGGPGDRRGTFPPKSNSHSCGSVATTTAEVRHFRTVMVRCLACVIAFFATAASAQPLTAMSELCARPIIGLISFNSPAIPEQFYSSVFTCFGSLTAQ